MLEPAARVPLPGVAVVAADRRVRDSLASVLGATGRVEVVGTAADPAAALRLVGRFGTDVILVDVSLADGSGAAPDGTRAPDRARSGPDGDGLIAQLRRLAPAARILVVDWADRPDSVPPREADGVLDANGLPGALLDVLSSGTPGAD